MFVFTFIFSFVLKLFSTTNYTATCKQHSVEIIFKKVDKMFGFQDNYMMYPNTQTYIKKFWSHP